MGLFSRHKDEDAPPDPSTLIAPDVAAPAAATAPATAGAGPVVVSATDGPMPATKEAFEAIHNSGGTTVDVSLTNTNLVDDEEFLELVELELREMATECGLTVGTIQRL